MASISYRCFSITLVLTDRKKFSFLFRQMGVSSNWLISAWPVCQLFLMVPTPLKSSRFGTERQNCYSEQTDIQQPLMFGLWVAYLPKWPRACHFFLDDRILINYSKSFRGEVPPRRRCGRLSFGYPTTIRSSRNGENLPLLTTVLWKAWAVPMPPIC